jgi:hypothetical protein
MKKKINKSGIYAIFIAIVALFPACEYQEFADTDYPEQLIYMPAAYYNHYLIDEITSETGDNPTPGNPERFQVDLLNSKFKVLLGVYRSGINANGSFDINIGINTDTIQNLLNTPNALPEGTLLLDPDKYSIINSVRMNDGQRLAKFDLEIDLDFLVNNYPNGIFALGVEISSDDREVNPDLALTILVVDTKIMLPTADFLFMVTGKTLVTKNQSQNSISYLWDFGDGTTSTEPEPEHTYAEPGNYTLTLEAIGITGEPEKSVVSKIVVIK